MDQCAGILTIQGPQGSAPQSFGNQNEQSCLLVIANRCRRKCLETLGRSSRFEPKQCTSNSGSALRLTSRTSWAQAGIRSPLDAHSTPKPCTSRNKTWILKEGFLWTTVLCKRVPRLWSRLSAQEAGIDLRPDLYHFGVVAVFVGLRVQDVVQRILQGSEGGRFPS